MGTSIYQNLSSSTLFNFTDSFDYLLGNLQFGIYCGDVYEKLPFSNRVGYKVPMISFCDIPLGMVKQHINWYGCYAIGIKREYARSKKINPVWYIHKDNPVIRKLYASKKHMELQKSPILPYLKQFLGYQKPIGSLTEKIKKFYDEKEWRYVPDDPTYSAELVQGKNHKENALLVDISKRMTRMPLIINWIEYIIIKDESEFVRLYGVLSSIGFKNPSDFPTIITTKQIRKDF